MSICIGRTARAGRNGGALLFVSEYERPYIELLRGRNVPLSENNGYIVNDEYTHKVLDSMKQLAMVDRDVLESGSTAFMAFLRAYQEHLCSYIFRIEELEIGSVARSYGLLRLPKIPETRGKKGKPIIFENAEVDTSKIAYRHKVKEQARLTKIIKLKEQQLMDEVTTEIKPEGKRKEEKKAEWDPNYEYNSDPKRKRKKKQSKHQQIMEEWDELAAEETMYRKFKKGKVKRCVECISVICIYMKSV
jgi:ATP-dependent RNA helicase DDX55/SPB4